MDRMTRRTGGSTSIRFAILIALLFGLLHSSLPAGAQNSGRRIFLPMVRNGAATALPLVTGFYPGGGSAASQINNVMRPLDNWLTGVNGGRATSIYGMFLDLNMPAGDVQGAVENLTAAWNAGYAPFINLPAGVTAKDIADGKIDAGIQRLAGMMKTYANAGKRFAYLAPLQEMNGTWVVYGRDSANFKRAYSRIQSIFSSAGVPRQSVKWVFAPNAWSGNSNYFEEYYPGDAVVDVVAFSAYNFGYFNGGEWQDPETVYNQPYYSDGFYLDRMRAMAPSKPIFIAQTASSSYISSGRQDAAAKQAWLEEAYRYLANQPNVRAVIYFNISNAGEPDWPVFSGGSGNPGYKNGVNRNGYRYISPAELMQLDHSIR